MKLAHSETMFCGQTQPQNTVPATEYSMIKPLASMIHSPAIKKKSANQTWRSSTTSAPALGSMRSSPDAGTRIASANDIACTSRRRP